MTSLVRDVERNVARTVARNVARDVVRNAERNVARHVVRSVLTVPIEETLGWKRYRRRKSSDQQAAEIVFKYKHAGVASAVSSSHKCGDLGASLVMLLRLC